MTGQGRSHKYQTETIRTGNHTMDQKEHLEEMHMIDPVDELASKLGVNVINQCGQLFIGANDFEKIVYACLDHNYLILGIEAFTLSENVTIPLMDYIADYSDLYRHEPWEEACKIALESAIMYYQDLKNRTDVYFDFVIVRPGETILTI